MPRPTSKPKLSKVDAHQLAQGILSGLKDYATYAGLNHTEASGRSLLSIDIFDLVEYARHGREPFSTVLDAASRLIPLEGFLKEELRESFRLILSAAMARYHIDIEGVVNVRSLGLLADLDVKQTRNILTEMRAKIRNAHVTARVAREFLIKRATSGYQPVFQRTG